MRRTLVSAAALVVLAATVAMLVQVRTSDDGDMASTGARAAVVSPVAVAPRSVVGSRTHPPALDGTADRSDGGDSAAARPPQQRATAEQMRDRLEARFVAGTGGTEGTRELQRALSDVLPGLLPAGSQLRSLDCRGAICRIETVHATSDAYEDFLNRAFGRNAPRLQLGGVFAAALPGRTPGQPIVTVAFVTPSGSPLFTPPQS